MDSALKIVSAAKIIDMISDLSGLPEAMFEVRQRADGTFDAQMASDLIRPETAQANLDAICQRLSQHYRVK